MNFGLRLDEILHDLYLAGWNDKLLDDSPTAVPSENQEKRKAKQALTSITKELVAEAKPKVKVHPLGPVTLATCQRGLDHYEANLLKGLEEVK